MRNFFCPGRTELAGNHTDHQKGRVIAAAVDRGISAQAQPNGDNVIRISSQGFGSVEIDLARLWPEEREVGTAAALVRGMAAQLDEMGLALQGFDAYLISDLTPGAGMASSAAFSLFDRLHAGRLRPGPRSHAGAVGPGSPTGRKSLVRKALRPDGSAGLRPGRVRVY
jgi:galactokinase